MVDLRLLVAQRIAESDGYLRKEGWPWERFSPPLRQQYLGNSDAAITTIMDHLIERAPEGAMIYTEEGYFADLDDWISCQRPALNSYRGTESEDEDATGTEAG